MNPAFHKAYSFQSLFHSQYIYIRRIDSGLKNIFMYATVSLKVTKALGMFLCWFKTTLSVSEFQRFKSFSFLDYLPPERNNPMYRIT